MPISEADHLRELLRVSRLLRQYGASHTPAQAGLFLAAAEALERRARDLAHLNETPPERVDLRC